MTITGDSRKILIAIGVAIGVLFVVATIIAVQPPTTFDPATPEGTTQGYFQAIDDGDQDRALSYMTEDLQKRCPRDDLRYRFRDVGDGRIGVVILSTTVDGDMAEVEVSVTEFYGGGPFNGGSYQHDETLVMERIGGRWLIVELPWPLFMCAPEG